MELTLRKIGNSYGVIIPQEELVKRGKSEGQTIRIDFIDDPFWSEISKFTKKERIECNREDSLSNDNLSEWEGL
jgi:antitoxin component of MazEF toxin-antitoxin module